MTEELSNYSGTEMTTVIDWLLYWYNFGAVKSWVLSFRMEAIQQQLISQQATGQPKFKLGRLSLCNLRSPFSPPEEDFQVKQLFFTV